MKNLSLKICLVVAALFGSVGNGFASDLPPCPSSGYLNNCYGTFTFADGDKYVGEYKDGKKHGQSTYTFANGDKYVGEFKDDEKHGQGTYTHANGDKYVGEYRDSKRHGQGTYTYSNGDKYVGEHENNKENGFGVFFYGASDEFSGDRFFGIFKDQEQKSGLYIKRNGRAKFFLNWRLCDNCVTDNAHNVLPVLKQAFNLLDKENRQATQKNLNKIGMYHSTIDGVWGKNTLSAIAEFAVLRMKTIEFNRREVSERIIDTILAGELSPTLKIEPAPVLVANTPIEDDKLVSELSGSGFVSDLPDCGTQSILDFHNCFGSWLFKSGNKYVGEWRESTKHGQGTFTWANGDTYLGDYNFNKRHGKGTYTYANGTKYVGDWNNDEATGQGVTTYPNGNRHSGQYKNGKRSGRGTGTLANGNEYVGDFKDDKINGQGTFTFADGEKYVGEFKDGKRNGQGTYTHADGTIKEGIWKDGEFQYAKKLSPPVPTVKAPTQDDEIISASSGSGFAVSSAGYVITNHHVIEGCQKVVLHTKEKDLTVRVITYDPQNDLALLKGDFRPSTVFPLSNNRPELLQDIYVAGYPFGNKVSTSVKVTKGIISSLTGIGNNFSNIQIDAALQSGNSGGPILDDLGNVVGVAVSKLDAKYMFDNFGSIPENTNFGIKSIIVRSVLDSNEVDSPPANQSEISKSKLGKMITDGTYYISCWMTMAQIEKMKTKKVFFSELE